MEVGKVPSEWKVGGFEQMKGGIVRSWFGCEQLVERNSTEVTKRPLLSLLGKSMLLSAIGKREVPIPEHIDIYHLTREMPPSDKTPLQCVMEVDTERAMLEREAERLAHEDGRAPGSGAGVGFLLGRLWEPDGPVLPTAECEKLMELYERLEELDADKAEMRASRILHGLGFTPAMQRKKLKDFSGGWRMRVALAR